MTAPTQTVVDPFGASPWLQGTFAPVADERTDHHLPVTGSLPPGLRGTFLRNGPNAMFPPITRYHLFDGDGMLHGVTFDGEGGASYANRWIRSAGLEAEIEAGHALFGGIAEFRLPPDDVFARVGPVKNTANTHVVRHAGRILALLEACGPTEIGPDLGTVGEYDFGGALQGPMTAHPKIDPVTGEMVFFGASPFPPFLRVHSAAPDGTLTWSTEVDLPASVMMHDFVITETKVVIFDLPAVMDVQALVAGGTGFYWDADRGARIGILERGADGSTTRWIDVDPFWVFHFLNAFDVGPDAVEVVGCRSPQLNASFDDTAVDPSVRPMLHRWRIDLGRGTVADEQLDDHPTDFPRINDAFAGRAHRYGYGGHALGFADGEPPFDGVTKFDLHGGAAATHRYGPGQVCGEAVFAADPASSAEDGGWLLNFVHDLAADRSDVVVLDAGTLDEVARVHLPRRVPFGFHGSFLPWTALLADLVAARGPEPAVIDERGVTTWAELDDRVTRLVHTLEDRGLRVGDSVVAMVGNQRELIEVTLACAHGGWLMVPVNWHWVAPEVAYVLDDADAAAVVVDHRWAEVMARALVDASVARLRCRLLVGDGPPVSGFERYDDAVAAASAAELVDAQRGGPMFYTSGTTGRPKGVRSALSAIGGPPEVLLLIAHTMAPIIGVTPGSRGVQLVCGPLYHSAQWAFGVFALLCGSTVVLQHRFDAASALRAIDEHGVTHVHLVPTQMIRMLELPDDVRAGFDGSSLAQIIHGAAPCSPSVKRRMIEWVGPKVTEYYGGTEGGFLSLISADEWLARPGSVGRPLTVVEVLVLGPDGEVLRPGETGDVWFRSLLGSDFEYHNAPEKTAGAHRDGGLGTLGDVGYLDDDGYLFLSDRKIDMVVSGGVNIYPAEIEGVLTDHRAVADAAVFGIPDDEMGEAVHAVVALRHGHVWSDSLQADITAFCRERLAGYKVPRSYEVLDALPRSEAGKLTKRQLRDPWWQGRDRAI